MLSLKGTNEINPLNLKGESYDLGNKNNKLNKDYTRWKNRMFSRLVIPIIQKDWKEIYDNIYLITVLKQQLDSFKNCDDIEFYRNILTFVERVYNQHKELSQLEKLLYHNKNGTSILYKTTMIRVSAEIEIYNNVFGKPDSGDYDQEIIQRIQVLMNNDTYTFNDIKQQLKNL